MANNKTLPMLSFAGMADYEPFAGGRGFVPQEGLYEAKIIALEAQDTKDPTRGTVQVTSIIQDEDVGHGIQIIDWVLYSGVDRKGNPLVRQFCDFLHSVGTPIEVIKQFGAAGHTTDINGALGQLVNRLGYPELKFGVYNGQLTSDVANWAPKQRYLDAKKNNAHRGRKSSEVNVADLMKAAASAQAQPLGVQPTFAGFSAPNLGGAVNLGGAPAGLPNLGGAANAGGAANSGAGNAFGIPQL